MWLLNEGGYDGTLYFDTFPVREDPANECAASVANVRRFEAALDRIDRAALVEAQGKHDALGVQRLLAELFEGGEGLICDHSSYRRKISVRPLRRDHRRLRIAGTMRSRVSTVNRAIASGTH